MPQCFAITKTTRTQCTAQGFQDGLCGKHAPMAEWQEERIRRATQNVVHEAPVLVPEAPVLVPEALALVPEDPIPILVPAQETVPVLAPVTTRPTTTRPPVVAVQRSAAQTSRVPPIDIALINTARQERIAIERREAQAQKLRNLMQFSPHRLVKFADDMADFWVLNRIPGYDLMRAYCALKHMPSHHPSFQPLLRASVQVMFLSKINDPQNREYTDIRTEESAPLFAALAVALVPYGQIRLTHYITASDRYRNPLIRRMRDDEAAERRRQEEVEARQAQLREDLRMRRVDFRRDPKDGVDLAQMATDHESVHRTSVQSTTERGINVLLARSLPSDQDAYGEILTALSACRHIQWASESAKQGFLHEFAQDYLDGMAFGIRYGILVDHVWAFIRSHEHRNELVIRFAQEVNDGRRSCVNGKMARLINALQGYDDSVTMPPPREVFQTQIERLRSKPVEERGAEARRLFEEYQIPGEEQAPWLEALEVV